MTALPNPLSANKLFQLFCGFMMGVGNIDEKGVASLNKCIPATWAVANAAPDGANDKADGGAKSLLTTVLNYIEKIVDFVCKFKKNLVDMLKDKKFLRYQRLFMENEKASIEKMQGFWETIHDKARDAFNKAKDTVGKVVTTVKTGAETVGKWLNKTWADLKAFGSEVLQNLISWWSAFKLRAKAIFTPIKDAIVTLYNCIKVGQGIVQGIIAVVKGIADKIQKITRVAAGDMIALAEIFIDLVCNFGRFRSAFTALASGISEAAIPKKYNYYGIFGGHLLAALTTS
jgi:hypothetical protein